MAEFDDTILREINEARQALARAPSNWEVWRNLGLKLWAGKQDQESLTAFGEALRLNPADAQCYAISGQIHLRFLHSEKAIEALTRAVELDPACCFAWYNLGQAHDSIGNDPETEKAFSNAFRLCLARKGPLEPSDAGFVAHQKEDLGNQFEFESDPPLYLAAQKLSGFYLRQGNPERAMETLTLGLAARPDSHFLLLLAGQTLMRAGKAAEAEPLLQRFITLKPGWAIGHRLLGGCQLELGKSEKAIESYQRVVALNPQNIDSHFELGVAFSRLNRLVEAEASYSEALRLAPEDAMCHYNLGCVQMKRKNFPAAVRLFEEAVGLNPSDPRFHHNLGISLRNLKRFVESVTALEEAVRIQPGFDSAWRDLGVTFSSMNRFAEAFKAYRKAIEINPGKQAAYFDLGLDLVATGNFVEALEPLGKAMENFPEDLATRKELFFSAIVESRKDLAERALEGFPILLKSEWETPRTLSDEAKQSPLHLAVSLGSSELVEWLISIGAPVNAVGITSPGTPLDLARRLVRKDISELLVRHGAVAILPGIV